MSYRQYNGSICVQEGHADCRTERAMKETGLTGKGRSTTIAATPEWPDDGKSQRKRRRIVARLDAIAAIQTSR